MKIAGDSKEVAGKAVEREAEAIEKLLGEARQAALNLLRDSYEKSLYEAERSLRDYVSRAEEQLRSLVSSLELELKTRVSEAKSKYVEEAIKRALEEVKKIKAGAEWYRKYMEGVIEAIAEQAGEGGMAVRVAPEDVDLARGIIEEKGLGGKLRLGDPVEITGGAIGVSPDGSVTLDYSLDLLVRMEEHRLRGVAARALFK